MKTLVRRSAVLALIGLILSPLAVAHASSPPADSVHFCQLIDFEQWRRDHPRPAGKRLALNKGEPRTVRMIYFLPNDRPFRQEVVDSMKVAIRRVQTFYAEQMQAHGYGNRTFRIETDAQGEPLVHRVDGRHSNRYYRTHDWFSELWEVFDPNENIYNIITDTAEPEGAVGNRYSKNGGYAWLGDIHIWGSSSHGGYAGVTAHELGHAFGLLHDFRDDAYIMSYGSRTDRLSACAAEFLSVHPYFNPEIPTKEGPLPTIELISPRTYPAGPESVPIQLKVADSQGLHQVILFGGKYNDTTVKACRRLSGERDAVVEFEYDGVIPSYSVSRSVSSLSAVASHPLRVQVVDSEGNVAWTNFVLAEISSHLIANLEEHTDEVNSVSFSPDGTMLASGASDDTVILWDVRNREQIATLEGHTGEILSLSFSPDGALLASGSSGMVILWDVRTREQIATLDGHTSTVGSISTFHWVNSVSFSPDGTMLASGASDGTVILWDVRTREQITTLDGHTSTVHSLSFLPDADGVLLASGASDGTVILWDVRTREQITTLDGHTSTVHSWSFSLDGALLASGASDGTVILWDVRTREQITTLVSTGMDWVNSVLFSPDGTMLASAGEDSMVRLWDILARQEIATFAHTDWVNSVSFSPDGALLASGSKDHMVMLWDISDISERTESRPFALKIISGDGQEGLVGEQLAKPFVVSVLEQDGSAFAGAVVSFSVTAGRGMLSVTTVTTNTNGLAATRLVLGSEPGTNTVAATVEGLESVTFTAIGQAMADSDGDELADDEPSGENQQEPEGQPTTAVEFDGISSSHTSVREKDGQATTITLTVTLDRVAAADETITLAIVTPTKGKAAKLGEDFDATLDGTITIAKGQTKGTAQLSLTPKDNTTADGDKAFAVQATSSSGHQALIDIKIVDDEMDGEDDGEVDDGEDDGEMAFGFAEEVADQAYTAEAAITPLVLPAASGGTGVLTYRLVGLPVGLVFDAATRTLSGTPSAATDGAVEVFYTVTDEAGTGAFLTFSITVNPPLSFGNFFGLFN